MDEPKDEMIGQDAPTTVALLIGVGVTETHEMQRQWRVQHQSAVIRPEEEKGNSGSPNEERLDD
jgi:hypothetical protein